MFWDFLCMVLNDTLVDTINCTHVTIVKQIIEI